MTLPDSIYAYLRTRAALVAIVGDNIFHCDTERQAPARMVSFEEIGGDPLRAFNASPVLNSVRVSFESWASDVAGASIVSGASAATAMNDEIYAAFCDPAGDKSGPFRGELTAGGAYIQDVRLEGPNEGRPLYDEGARKRGRELDLTFDYRL